MQVLAAVDIGSNSVRLKIARLERGKLRVLHEDREVTRLGEGVFRNGVLSPKSIEQTIKVLRRFHKAAQNFGVTKVRAVATSAIRDSNNSSAFLDWIWRATGWKVDVISGLEEGRLIHLGVTANAALKANRMLLIDLGGGSCELTISHRGNIEEMFSLPLGAVRLTRDFLAHDPARPAELESLRSFINEEISRVETALSRQKVDLVVATSGTPAALSDAWSALRKKPGPPVVPAKGVLRLAEQLSDMRVAERRNVKGIGPKRAEIIVAGAWVFALLLGRLKLPEFRYLPFGLRDGLLEEMAAGVSRAPSKTGRRLSEEREKSLLAVAQHYEVDVDFANRVSSTCTQLFEQLKPVHKLPPEYLEIVRGAAMLEEVGSYVSRVGRRRHAYYLVSHSELLGFTARERRIMAALVRFLGKSRPGPNSTALRRIDPADRAAIPKAVVLLRLARALDQSRRGLVKKPSVKTARTKVTLTLPKRNTELELWAAEKERAYFKEVFKRSLVCRAG